MARSKKQADPLGRYYTPPAFARQCVDKVLPWFPVRPYCRILEPSAGGGSFLGPLRRGFPSATITAIDLDPGGTIVLPEGIEAIERRDFLTYRFDRGFDLIVGNPPFHHGQEFVEKALTLAPVVVFLLRLGFLASLKRWQFWTQNPPAKVFVLPKRPSFTGDGGVDRYDYCFVGWQSGTYQTRLHWLPPLSNEVKA